MKSSSDLQTWLQDSGNNVRSVLIKKLRANVPSSWKVFLKKVGEQNYLTGRTRNKCKERS